MFKKLILAGAGVLAAAASVLPAYACQTCGCGINSTAPAIGNIGASAGSAIGCGIMTWGLPWTPFSWGLALPSMCPWSWW
jgi:hypothetical protein